jgi:hypothetical protein
MSDLNLTGVFTFCLDRILSWRKWAMWNIALGAAAGLRSFLSLLIFNSVSIYHLGRIWSVKKAHDERTNICTDTTTTELCSMCSHPFLALPPFATSLLSIHPTSLSHPLASSLPRPHSFPCPILSRPSCTHSNNNATAFTHNSHPGSPLQKRTVPCNVSFTYFTTCIALFPFSASRLDLPVPVPGTNAKNTSAVKPRLNIAP